MPVFWHLQIKYLRVLSVWRSTQGCYMPTDLHSLWGTCPASSLQAGTAFRGNSATHMICLLRDGNLIHSVSLFWSVLTNENEVFIKDQSPQTSHYCPLSLKWEDFCSTPKQEVTRSVTSRQASNPGVFTGPTTIDRIDSVNSPALFLNGSRWNDFNAYLLI